MDWPQLRRHTTRWCRAPLDGSFLQCRGGLAAAVPPQGCASAQAYFGAALDIGLKT